MHRLDVSGAVRCLYASLGFRGLIRRKPLWKTVCFFSKKKMETLNIAYLCFLNILPLIETLGTFYLRSALQLQQRQQHLSKICRQNVAFVPFLVLNFNWPTNRGEVVTCGHTKRWQSNITLQMLRLTCIRFKHPVRTAQ